MNLPDDRKSQYRSSIRRIEALLKDATSPDVDYDALTLIQRDLDELAEKFQHDESLGSSRYKLYELQALIHYFNEDDDNALNFIEQAAYLKGPAYPLAERLRGRIENGGSHQPEDSSVLSKSERRKRLIGLEGWLAFFCVGIGISVLINLFGLYGYGEAFNNFNQAESQMPGISMATTPLLWFEILVSIGLATVEAILLVLLGKHKKSGVNLALVVLVAVPILGIIDYAWTSAIFQNFGLDDSQLSSTAGDVGRGIIAACIWIPYFIVSKRVKATLVR